MTGKKVKNLLAGASAAAVMVGAGAAGAEQKPLVMTFNVPADMATCRVKNGRPEIVSPQGDLFYHAAKATEKGYAGKEHTAQIPVIDSVKGQPDGAMMRLAGPTSCERDQKDPQTGGIMRQVFQRTPDISAALAPIPR